MIILAVHPESATLRAAERATATHNVAQAGADQNQKREAAHGTKAIEADTQQQPALQKAGDQGEPERLTLAQALRQGSASVNLRHRYEYVTDDAFEEDAHASTLRTTLGYRSRPYKGFDVLLEAENVSVVGNDLFNNKGSQELSNRRIDRPVVADPALTRMNQAVLSFTTGDTAVKLGRQEIVLDDQRFVGNVGWRQHHQSFDTVRLVTESLPGTTVNYAFLHDVHRIFGDSEPLTGHVLNAKVAAGDVGTVVLYGYSLDYEADARRSTSTYGSEFSGQWEVGDAGRLLYEIEYAWQDAASGNPDTIDADYFHLMGGGGYRGVTFSGGWERLSGSPENGQFNTPLATLHAFNGWADKFLVTPTDGLEDRYLSVTGTAGPVRWTAVYHDFRADTGDARYGDEVDVELVYSAPWRQVFALKAALYEANGFSTDIGKLMLWTSFGI